MYTSLDVPIDKANNALQAAETAWPGSARANTTISQANPLFTAAQSAVNELDPRKRKKPSAVYFVSARTRSSKDPQEAAYNKAKKELDALTTLHSQVIQLNTGLGNTRVVEAATSRATDPEGYYADIKTLMAQIAGLQRENQRLVAALSELRERRVLTVTDRLL